MKELLRTTDITTITFAKSILEGEGIPCFEFDTHMSVFEGSIGNFLPRRLMVADRDHFLAVTIMNDHEIDLGQS